MAGYICVTHPTTHREEAEHLCRTLGRYGFRFRVLTEDTTPTERERLLAEASALLAVTGVSAKDRGHDALAGDIQRGLARHIMTLLLSLQENELDQRFTGGAEEHAVLIPYTVVRMPDRHSIALFLHRLFVRHLASLPGCFHSERCVDDGHGTTVSLAARAHAGDGAACYALGLAYERGEHVPAIEHEAALWITRAADLGVPNARIHMGELHLMGRCRHPDPAEAYRLFSIAADAGDVRGYYHRGLCAFYGLGTEAAPEVAMADLMRAAAAGYAPALYRVGLLYSDHIGQEPNAFVSARHCLYAACRQGMRPVTDTALEAQGLADVAWTPVGTNMPWTPAESLGSIPMVWTPIEPRAGRADAFRRREVARATSADRCMDTALRAGIATPERVAAVDGTPLPPLPSLYSRRRGKRPQCVTVRHMRRTRLWSLASHRPEHNCMTPQGSYPGRWTVGYASPALRAEEALAAGCFTRTRVRTEVTFARRSIQNAESAPAWTTVLLGARASLPARSFAEREDLQGTYLGRAAFDVADAAMALGRVLELGDPAYGHAPHPTRAAVWYRYAAFGGSSEAFRCLGDLYRRGYGLPADPVRAVELYRLSADCGDPQGQFALAVACERGIGTECDPMEAVRLYTLSAEAGYAPARNNLGGCWEYGIGVHPDLLAAVECYTRAAAAGQPDALCRLGLCYERGRGVEVDLSRALRLYESAARQGHPHALYRLGLCYERGLVDPQISDDADVATSCAIPSGTVPPPPEGGASEALRSAPHYAEAIYLWEEAASRGLPMAAYALALCHDNGHGVRADAAEAVRWLTVAAEGGHVPALYRLGICCLEGHGITPDGARAVRYFSRAVALWEARETTPSAAMEEETSDSLPVGAMTPNAAAGGAYYMRGYCTLYALGEGCQLPTVAPSATTPDPIRLARAEADLRRAATLGHVGALTALGDLYTYGLLKPAIIRPGASEAEACADQALELYTEAIRVGMARVATTASANEPDAAISGHMPAEGLLRDDTFRESLGRVGVPRAIAMRGVGDMMADDPLHALLTVAELTSAAAEAREAAGEAAEAEMARVQVWRSLAGAAELGSVDALIAMAACTFFGHGTPENRTATIRLLQRAAEMGNGRILASLWLGDLYYSGWFGRADPQRADDAYRRALNTPPVESECGAYIIAHRRETRLAADRKARAEVLYRVATLRAVTQTNDPTRGYAFQFLVSAVLAGHQAAEEDFARMYAREIGMLSAALPGEAPAAIAAKKSFFVRLPGYLTHHDASTLRPHGEWMADYYTALSATTDPFKYPLISEADPEHTPFYVTAPVTDTLRVNALNYLGDCFFEGNGLTADAASAVSCYRRAVTIRLNLARGVPPPVGLCWAQYSLGWCLLRGVGTPRDPREAVKWLTLAAATHAEAAYSLAECYETGAGVDVSDNREAIKYYRKAYKLGCARAEDKVIELEDRLRALQ